MLIAVLAAHPQRQLQFARLIHTEDELPEGCKDERPDCAGWAADGECEANPGYMMTSCAHSCTRCGEGPSGVGVMRSKKERAGRRDSACENLDDDCEARVAAGGCHDGSDTPLRCPSGCRICRFPEVAKEAYGCSGTSLFGSCERRRRRCARPQDTPPLVTTGDIDVTMRRILTDFPQYNPRAISRPAEGAHGEGERVAPWVITLQDFLSDDEVGPPPRAAAEPSPSPCAPALARPQGPNPGPEPQVLSLTEQVAAFIDGCAHQFSRSFAGDVLSPVRTSLQCWCSHNECDRNPLTHVVARRIANVTRAASERYMEPFQVLKYQPGQFYRTHHDQNSGLFTPQAPSRVITPQPSGLCTPPTRWLFTSHAERRALCFVLHL